MKIEFITGKSSYNGEWNTRKIWWRERQIKTMGTFYPAGSTEVNLNDGTQFMIKHKKNHIMVVKQPTLYKTLKVLFHELCHWLVHKVLKHNYSTREKWHNRIDRYL